MIAMSIVSCQMLDGEDGENKLFGNLQLTVQKKEPGTTRAVGDIDTRDFLVKIADGADYNAQYVVGTMPETMKLPVGNYTVEACSPGELSKTMTAPYYSGKASMEIKDGITTQTVVNCKQQNSKIMVNYGEEFRNAFSEWTITINDGNTMALLFDNTQSTVSPVYCVFDDNVKTLRVNIVATPTDGSNKVKGSLTITKADATEHYDEDNENFSGGDAITLNIGLGNADEPYTPVGNGILSVSANMQFNNYDEAVSIPVVWEGDEQQGTDDGDKGQGDGDAISITFSSNDVTYSISKQNAPNPLDALIEAKEGLSSVKVKIETTCSAFEAALADLAESDLHLLTGHELVGDQILPFVFSSLGMGNVSMPEDGATSYTFPIASFYQFIEMYMDGVASADFSFDITVVDKKGSIGTSTLNLTITQ